jgi:hypothetical protein
MRFNDAVFVCTNLCKATNLILVKRFPNKRKQNMSTVWMEGRFLFQRRKITIDTTDTENFSLILLTLRAGAGMYGHLHQGARRTRGTR